MGTTLLKEVFGVRQFLGDPLSQAPSTRQIIQELEAEYQQLTGETANRGGAQHVGEKIITTVAGQMRYDLAPDQPGEPEEIYKVLSVTTVPEAAVITGDSHDKDVTVSSGDDREDSLEFMELERFSDDWPYLAPNRGQIFGSSHDSQAVAFFKVIDPQLGEVLRMELRPTPSEAQRYRVLYQLTDWWDRVFQNSALGAADTDFKMPHTSQRMMVRCYAGLNLIQKNVVKWALNEEYNTQRAAVVQFGLKDKLERYRKTYEDFLDTMEHGDVIYVELWGDRI